MKSAPRPQCSINGGNFNLCTFEADTDGWSLRVPCDRGTYNEVRDLIGQRVFVTLKNLSITVPAEFKTWTACAFITEIAIIFSPTLPAEIRLTGSSPLEVLE